MKKSIAIIDTALKTPAIPCFNRLQRECNALLSYHNFPSEPSSLEYEEGFSKIIVLGSHSNIGDGSSWHKPLADFLLKQLQDSIPVFGICFAHQLMAHSFGSTLKQNNHNKNLEGLREVKLIKNFFDLEETKLSFFCSHHYQIEKLSENLEVIGTAKDSPYEFIAHKKLPYWSCQSHPEGSDYFLKNDISFELKSSEVKLGKHDGLRLLKSFING